MEQKTVRLNIKIPTELHKRFKIACTRKGETQTVAVLRFMEAYADDDDQENQEK